VHIQARVDIDSLAIKLSRRNDKKEWVNNYESIAISSDVMEMGSVHKTDNNMEVSISQSSL
jgi:hypothetical protein